MEKWRSKTNELKTELTKAIMTTLDDIYLMW